MFLFVILLCSVLQPILHYYCVFGKRESLQRFVVEDGAKPAIFGSYSYDPVRQVFVPPPPDPNSDNSNSKDLLDHKTYTKPAPETDSHTNHEADVTPAPETDPHTNQKTDTTPAPETDPPTNHKTSALWFVSQEHRTTSTKYDTQTATNGKTLPHTPSVTIPSQSRQDSFISTAGDTGTDNPDGENEILRKKVEQIISRPWFR